MADLKQILASLSFPRHTLGMALPAIPAKPGLYAIYGNDGVWSSLGLGSAIDGLPLYVGKSEDSLADRDLKTHFGNGRTGTSTVRRSFAALLRDELQLTAVPRNPANPGHFSNYGLSAADDVALTNWMRSRLEIAFWIFDQSRPLAAIETDVLRHLHPPLNIQGVDHKWKAGLKAQRAVMAAQARAWQPMRT